MSDLFFQPINLFSLAIFSRITVKINNQEILPALDKTLPLKAYLESLLSLNSTNRKTIMKLWHYEPSENDNLHQYAKTQSTTTAYAKRAAANNVAKGESFWLQVPMFIDLMHVSKYLPTGTNLVSDRWRQWRPRPPRLPPLLFSK